MKAIVRHFDARNARFAFDHAFGGWPGSPTADARLPAWLASAARQAKSFVDTGLPVYALATPPLRPGYPWQATELRNVDVLLAVRPHRFGFLPRLALAVRASALPLSALDAIVGDWMTFAAEEPALPFISNLVAIQRLIAMTWAFHCLADDRGTQALLECRYRLLNVIEQDVAYLLPRLGHSFPNNHLLVDRFAAWFIALHYPEFHRVAPDAEALEQQWLSELVAQTYADGGGIEHSVHYHGLASEMAAKYLVLARAAGRPAGNEASAHVERMLRLQADLCGPDGNAPDIGDSSVDPLFPFDDGSCGNAAAFREIHRTLFDPSRPGLDPAHAAHERAFWICGGVTAPAARGESRRFAEYPQSGLTIFFDDDEATRCTFRSGPSMQEKVLPGHMHADALSVTLTVRGRPILVDAGTATYRFRRDSGTTNWRDYFAGPRAHNGLVVGDVNPLGPLRGDFRSKTTLPGIVRVASDSGEALAFHESRMPAGDGHPQWTRGIVHLRGAGFIVYDIVDEPRNGVRPHLAMQLDAECSAHAVADGQLTIRSADVAIGCAYSTGLDEPAIVVGREEPPGGWISRTYSDRTPAAQLVFGVQARSALTAFAIYGHGHDSGLSIECAVASPDARCFLIDGGDVRDYVLLNVGPHDTPISQWGITFAGRLAWIRVARDGAPRLRWLAGKACEAPALGLAWRFDQAVPELSRSD